MTSCLKPIRGARVADGFDRSRCTARSGVIKAAEYVRLGLTLLGLHRRIAMLAGFDETRRHKPAPDPLLYAAQLVGAASRDCVYVSDAVPDVAAGKAAGMGDYRGYFRVLDDARA
jgi:beta-phosphoglucomutase-like phosphatase (HAD superfamily)